jgi:hypothetical protein
VNGGSGLPCSTSTRVTEEVGMTGPPDPPFTRGTAVPQVRLAEDA